VAKFLKGLQIYALVGSLLLPGMSAWATDAQAVDEEQINRPGYGVAVADAVLVRPVTLIATIVGAVVFVVTSPITALTGTIGEAGQTLVVEPALTTFYRCLGCTETGWREFPQSEETEGR